MYDNYTKILNSNKVILEHLDDIKEAFITFYGEESREFIENKFKHFNLVTFIPDTVLSNIISHVKEELSFKAVKKILDLQGTHYEETASIFRGYESLFKNEQYSQFLEMYELQENGRKLNGITEEQYENIKLEAANYLKEVWKEEVNSNNIEKLQSEGYFNDITNFFKLYKKYLKEYEKEINLSKYIEEEKQNKERKDKLKEKYKIKLIEEFLPEELDEYKKSGTSNIIQNFIGSDFDKTSNVEYFSDKYDEKLLNDKEYIKNYIRIKRIKFFNSFGINLGKDYETYEHDEECKKLISDKEFKDYINILIQRRKEYIEQFNEEYYDQMIEYEEIEEKIKSFNLVCEDNGFSTDTYTKHTNGCYIFPNAKEENGVLVENPIMFINGEIDLRHLDEMIIHEMNHILELNLIKKTDNHLEFTCGWDHSNAKFVKEEELNLVNKRDFEMFNEIINEMIAQSITKILHAKGHYIFTEKGQEEYGTSYYQKFLFLVKDFLNEYLDDIISSRRNNNINHIFEVVEQENFIKLNNLINEFNEINKSNELSLLSTIFYNESYDDINGKSNINRETFQSIGKKNFEILQSMREYSKRNVQSL